MHLEIIYIPKDYKLNANNNHNYLFAVRPIHLLMPKTAAKANKAIPIFLPLPTHLFSFIYKSVWLLHVSF